MLEVAQAEALIWDLVRPFGSVGDGGADQERVPLRDAYDRILAADITSNLDFPHWDNSAMDGYAVRFEDVQACSAEHPITLDIVDTIPAGTQPHAFLQPGQAARILTGSMMPAGADTIVIQENTQPQQGSNQVTILSPPQALGAFVRKQGSFYQAGHSLLSQGVRVQAAELAILAAAQCTQVSVYRRPTVAILSTGDELVTIDQPLKLGQIVDSNQYALAALVIQAGGIPVPLGIIPDDPTRLKQAIVQAMSQADVILSSGGVSVGDYDYVESVLAELGAIIHLRSVAMKPGKPLTVATFSKTPRPVLYFGLPGNPVSALVTFWRFVQPALKKLAGLAEGWQPRFVQALTLDSLKADPRRETYLWGRLHLVNGVYEFQLARGGQSSGNLINLAQTNGLARLMPGQGLITPGSTLGSSVQVLQVG